MEEQATQAKTQGTRDWMGEGVEVPLGYSAEALARVTKSKVRELEGLANLDHGLWHGKLIDEVRRSHP